LDTQLAQFHVQENWVRYSVEIDIARRIHLTRRQTEGGDCDQKYLFHVFSFAP
jgi:hypothetical protein